MIWERNDTGANAENHTWMNLTMCPLMSIRIDCRFYPLTRIIRIKLLFHPYPLLNLSTHLQIFGCHSNHNRFLLFRINVLDNSIRYEIVPAESFGFSVVRLLTSCVESVDMALCEH